MQIDIKLKKSIFNEKYLPYLVNKLRYLIFYGGAGSGKSFFVCQRYVYKILKKKLCNLLVVRATGKSNRDSTFALFKQVINKWNLSKYFKVNESDLRIKCLLNGNEITFSGLDDVEKLKSITFSNGVLTDVWMEEASEILESDFNQLDVRLRGIGTDKQIVISFNPIDVNHWLKKRFFDRQSDKVAICHSTYKDNKFLDDDYKALLESYKYTDEYYYNVYCLGMWGVLGKTVFDARKINERLQNIPKPLKIGYFLYDYDGLKITNIRWVNSPDGYIRIYKVPHSPAQTKYCIGGDTAGEGSDKYTGHVLNAKTGEQVAVLKREFDSDIYAKQMYCLGYYYASKEQGRTQPALMCIEANYDSYPIMELQRLGYFNQYIREKMDEYTGKMEKRYGFKTTQITRPVIISNLIQIVREHTELLNDKDTLEELLTIIRNEKGRIEAPVGGHDDHMMGLAIAYEARGQVNLSEDSIKIYPEFNFQAEEDFSLDYGERIQVV